MFFWGRNRIVFFYRSYPKLSGPKLKSVIKFKHKNSLDEEDKLSVLCELFRVLDQQLDMKSPYFWVIHTRRPRSAAIVAAIDVEGLNESLIYYFSLSIVE